METQKGMIIYAPKARNSINHTVAYIKEKGYPDTAKQFADTLYVFGNSLAKHPNAYPICKQSQLAKRNMRCAVFHGAYIFVYKKVNDTLIIYNVIHGKTNPFFHSV